MFVASYFVSLSMVTLVMSPTKTESSTELAFDKMNSEEVYPITKCIEKQCLTALIKINAFGQSFHLLIARNSTLSDDYYADDRNQTIQKIYSPNNLMSASIKIGRDKIINGKLVTSGGWYYTIRYDKDLEVHQMNKVLSNVSADQQRISRKIQPLIDNKTKHENYIKLLIATEQNEQFDNTSTTALTSSMLVELKRIFQDLGFAIQLVGQINLSNATKSSDKFDDTLQMIMSYANTSFCAKHQFDATLFISSRHYTGLSSPSYSSMVGPICNKALLALSIDASDKTLYAPRYLVAMVAHDIGHVIGLPDELYLKGVNYSTANYCNRTECLEKACIMSADNSSRSLVWSECSKIVVKNRTSNGYTTTCTFDNSLHKNVRVKRAVDQSSMHGIGHHYKIWIIVGTIAILIVCMVMFYCYVVQCYPFIQDPRTAKL